MLSPTAPRKVVNKVTLEIKQGEIVGLLGPNGAGKTTTFYMVVGLTRPDDGQVFLNDADITNFPMHQRAKKGTELFTTGAFGLQKAYC